MDNVDNERCMFHMHGNTSQLGLSKTTIRGHDNHDNKKCMFHLYAVTRHISKPRRDDASSIIFCVHNIHYTRLERRHLILSIILEYISNGHMILMIYQVLWLAKLESKI